jgi:F-type H+-transporting ATPase subunit b
MAQPQGPATTGATTATPPGGQQAIFPPFHAEAFPGQLLWFAIAFGALYYLMSKLALPRVAETLEGRRQRIARDLEDAQQLRLQSEEAGAAYEAALAAARDKAKGIAQTTREALSTETEVRRKALEADLAGKLAEAEATIRSRTDAAMANVRDIAADAATAIVERLTGRAPDPARIRSALDRTVQA